MPQVQLIHQYVQSLQFERGLALRTLAKYADDLDNFAVFVEGRGKSFLSVERSDCQEWLKSRIELDSANTANQKLTIFKKFFEFLIREGVISDSPFVLVLPAKGVNQDIGAVMSVATVLQLLDAISSIRDRAMFELMYASGLRISELVNLRVHNIHIKSRFVQVTGKGGVERIVPINDFALEYVVEYIKHHRPASVTSRSGNNLFLTKTGSKMGSQMSAAAFYQTMMRYMVMAGIPKIYSPHSIRHAFATHLVNAGVDILTISRMMGHASVNTTAIYTHYSRDHLKAFLEKHHPLGVNYVKFVREP